MPADCAFDDGGATGSLANELSESGIFEAPEARDCGSLGQSSRTVRFVAIFRALKARDRSNDSDEGDHNLALTGLAFPTATVNPGRWPGLPQLPPPFGGLQGSVRDATQGVRPFRERGVSEAPDAWFQADCAFDDGWATGSLANELSESGIFEAPEARDCGSLGQSSRTVRFVAIFRALKARDRSNDSDEGDHNLALTGLAFPTATVNPGRWPGLPQLPPPFGGLQGSVRARTRHHEVLRHDSRLT